MDYNLKKKLISMIFVIVLGLLIMPTPVLAGDGSKVSTEDDIGVKCTAHQDADTDVDTLCDYCGTDISSAAASVTVGKETYYFLADSGTTTIKSAVEYANEHNNDNAVLMLLSNNLTITDAHCAIDLNGMSVTKLTSGGLGLVVNGSGIVEYLEAGSFSGILKGGTYQKIKTDSGTKLGDLLAEGYGFKSNGLWLAKDNLEKSGDLWTHGILDVTVTPLPITSLSLDAPESITYGNDLEMTATVTKPDTTTSTVTYQWYQDGTELTGKTSNTIKISDLAYKEGGYTFYCEATCDGYSLSKEVTVMVNKADLSNAELTINNPESLVCTLDGTGGSSLKTLNVNYTVSYGGKTLVKGIDFTVSGDVSVSEAGTYTLTVTGMGNYTGTKSLTYTVKPCTLPDLNNNNGDWEKSYDGTTDISEKAPNVLTFKTINGTEVTLTNGADYTVEAAHFNTATAENSKLITLTIKLINKNFTFEDNKDEKTFSGVLRGSIKKATATDPATGNLEVTNDLAKTYTYDLTKLLPGLTNPATYGVITYGTPDVKLSAGYYTDGATIDKNGVLSLPIQWVNTTTEGAIGTVSAIVKTENYENIILTIQVSAKNKPVSSGSYWYDYSSTDKKESIDTDKDIEVKEQPSTIKVPVSFGQKKLMVNATINGTKAIMTATTKQIKKIIKSREKTVTIDLSSFSDVDTVKLPANMISKIGTMKNVKVNIKMKNGVIKLGSKAVKKINTGKSVTISIQQQSLTDDIQQIVESKGSAAAIWNVKLYMGKKRKVYLGDLDLTISFPYTLADGEDASKLEMYFIQNSGQMKKIGGMYKVKSKCYVFKTNRLTQYLLIHNER